jgi:hypothetical protein
MEVCRYCGGSLWNLRSNPSFSYATDRYGNHKKYYHQRCLFKYIALKFESEKEEK